MKTDAGSKLLVGPAANTDRTLIAARQRIIWLRRLLAAMDNASLPNDVRNNVTDATSSPQSLYLSYIPYFALKIIYIIIGSVGVLDNLFVIIVFALFINISDKVLTLSTLK